MIRLFFRSIAINLAGVYISFSLLTGIVSYKGGFRTLLLTAFLMVIINLFVRPIINLLLLPVHLLTLGLFRWVANIAVLYLITIVVPGITIYPFQSASVNLPFLIIPSIQFSTFGAFLYCTLIFSLVFHTLYWLFQD